MDKDKLNNPENNIVPDKPFETYERQIEILRNRNLIIDDDVYAKHVLASYSYYDLINGIGKNI